MYRHGEWAVQKLISSVSLMWGDQHDGIFVGFLLKWNLCSRALVTWNHKIRPQIALSSPLIWRADILKLCFRETVLSTEPMAWIWDSCCYIYSRYALQQYCQYGILYFSQPIACERYVPPPQWDITRGMWYDGNANVLDMLSGTRNEETCLLPHVTGICVKVESRRINSV